MLWVFTLYVLNLNCMNKDPFKHSTSKEVISIIGHNYTFTPNQNLWYRIQVTGHLNLRRTPPTRRVHNHSLRSRCTHQHGHVPTNRLPHSCSTLGGTQGEPFGTLGRVVVSSTSFTVDGSFPRTHINGTKGLRRIHDFYREPLMFKFRTV